MGAIFCKKQSAVQSFELCTHNQRFWFILNESWRRRMMGAPDGLQLKVRFSAITWSRIYAI